MKEFINLRQRGMSVLDYSLKFTKLSKYAPYLLSNHRDEMSHFLTGVFEDLVEECCSVMIHDNINISRPMVYAQQVEDKRKNREDKRAKPYLGGSSKGRLDIQDMLMFKRGFLIKFLPNFPWLMTIGCITLSLKEE